MLNESKSNTFDCIVIGSGIGGMTAAAVLSRVNNKRVLVLEQHFESGGLSHIFSRGRFTWEVGVHYVGMMKKGMTQRLMMDFITEKTLNWLPMPEKFERYVYPDDSFCVSSIQRNHIAELIGKFPVFKKQIKKYFRDINRSANWYIRRYLAGFLPEPVSSILRAYNFVSGRIPLMTTKQYIDTYIPDEKLATILTQRWGDYGTTPDESCFAMHAVVMKHYSHGGFVPEGNSRQIASTIERVIAKKGGMVLTNRQVTQILIKNNTAVGVKVVDKKDGSGNEAIYYAPIIISNAGAENTYGHLVQTATVKKLKEKVRSLPIGYSAVTVYLGLHESPEKLGVSGENLWINEKPIHADAASQTRELLAGKPKGCFVSFPSVRDGTTKHHTATIITVVDFSAFEQWKDQAWLKKDTDYQMLKEKIAQSLIALVERHMPGFSELIAFSEVSTPLTMEYFTNRSRGPMYGFKPTAELIRKRSFKVKTPVKGLYLSGADVCSPGITGAMMGGVAAASTLNGYFGFVKILASARRYARKDATKRILAPAENRSFALAGYGKKFAAKLTRKLRLTDSIYEFCFEMFEDADCSLGQYARFQYNDMDCGSYSIVTIKDRVLKFIIDIKYGGKCACSFNTIEPGDHRTIRFQTGEVAVRQNDNKVVFVSTGTGIAPQLAMLERMALNKYSDKVKLFFGCRYAKDNFIERYLKRFEKQLQLDSVVCVSRELVPDHMHGRVTKPIGEFEQDLDSYDFYVSGNPAMVDEITEMLRVKGAPNIFTTCD